MPLHYVDTSALIKRYLPETGSAWVRNLLSSDPVTISTLAFVEVASVLARRTRAGELTPGQRDALVQAFAGDIATYVVVGLTRPVIQEASRTLLATLPSMHLRSLDALHLASARQAFGRAGRRGVSIGTFVTADRSLMRAAAALGMTAVNPEDST